MNQQLCECGHSKINHTVEVDGRRNVCFWNATAWKRLFQDKGCDCQEFKPKNEEIKPLGNNSNYVCTKQSILENMW